MFVRTLAAAALCLVAGAAFAEGAADPQNDRLMPGAAWTDAFASMQDYRPMTAPVQVAPRSTALEDINLAR